jgi:hypothetical protein
LYFHKYSFKGRGGAWIWCSQCKAFEHSSAIVPYWWLNLELINSEQLAAVPEYLETVSKEVDSHWVTLCGSS